MTSTVGAVVTTFWVCFFLKIVLLRKRNIHYSFTVTIQAVPRTHVKKNTVLKNSLKGGGDNINQLVKRSVTCNS